MNREIKTTIALDGEQKFKREIADAKKNLANLGTQLTLAAAQFKNDNDAMKLVETRSKTLRDEITQQEHIVKALSGAVKDSSEKYGENSDQVSKWQAEMNRAAAKLENLRHELANNEQGLDKNGKAFRTVVDSADNASGAVDDFADAMADASSNTGSVDFLAFDTALKNISTTASGVVDTIKNLSTSVWNLVSEASVWADDLATLSAQTGISMEELQKWRYAARFVDTDVDDIIKGIDEMRKKATDGSTETAKLFNTLGVRTREASGKVRDAKDIFWDTVTALKNVKDESTRTAIAQKLFGEKYKELLPLINAGKSAWDEYGEAAKAAGLVLSDDQVKALGDFNDSLNKIQVSSEALKNNFAAGLAPGMQTIADKFSELTEKANAWAQSEEGKEALGKLSEAIMAVVDALTKDVDFNKLVEGAADVLKQIGEALTWVKDNPDKVLDGVKTALVGMAAIKMVGPVVSLLTALKSVVAFGGSVFGALGTVLDKLKGLGGAALTGAKDFLAKLAGTTVTDANATNLGSMADSLGKMNGMSGLGKVSSFLSGLAKVAVPVALVVGLQELYKVSHQLREEAAAPEKVEAAMKDDGLVQDFRNYQQALKEFGDAAKIYGADDDMYLLAQANVELARYRMMQHEGAESLDAAWNLWHEKNSDKNFFDGMIPDDPSELIHVLEGNIEEASDKAGETAAEESKEIGVQIDNGVAQGIEENADTAVAAAKRLAGYVTDAIQEIMMIHSPSKVMERLGEFVSQGFADGISGAAWRVDDAVTRMTGLASAPAIRQPVAVAAVGNGRAAVGAGYGNIQAIIMMDKTVVGEMVAPVVDGALQAQIEAVRR